MEKSLLPKSIDSGRVVLRQHKIEIAPTMFQYVDKDRDRLRKFLPWVDSTKNVEDEIAYIQMTLDKWEKFELFDYGIFDRATQTYMGNVGVHSIKWRNQCCELGYWILGDFEGKGFVSDAVRGLEKACFELGFHRVEIRCSSLNLKSASVPRRLGYKLEGVLSQDGIDNGHYRDTMIFGKLKTDWQLGQSNKPALMGLNHIYLFVGDMQASANWYEEVLGVKPLEKLKEFVNFQLGQSELCLHYADTKSPLSVGGSVGYWRTPNIKTTISHFEKHGAKVYRGPLDIGSGQLICQIKDPFGNVIGLIGNE